MNVGSLTLYNNSGLKFYSQGLRQEYCLNNILLNIPNCRILLRIINAKTYQKQKSCKPAENVRIQTVWNAPL